MNQNEQLEEMYEDFEGELRKLDELVGQLELWSDEYTINHKKEEVRLVQYVELNDNLEELKSGLYDFLETRLEEEGVTTRLEAYQQHIQAKLQKYQETEDTIHGWIRDIKEIHLMVARQSILAEHQEMLQSILEQ